jgi:hypothetical protein
MANIEFCGTSGGNTGLPRCDIRIGIPTGVLFVPRDATITPEQGDDLLTLIQTKAKDANPLQRWYPIFGVQNITDSSEEAVTGNLAATGYSEKLRDGAAIYLLEYPASLCKSKILKQFDQWNGGIFIITSDNRLWGRGQRDGSLAPYLPSSVYVYGGGWSDGQNIITSKLNINFGEQGNFIELSAFFGFEVNDDILSIVGLQTAQIVPTATAKTYRVLTKCDKLNLYDLYSTELADDALWIVTVASTGATVAVTAVAANASRDFTLTFTEPAEKYYVSLAGLAALEAAGIVGYESEQLAVIP